MNARRSLLLCPILLLILAAPAFFSPSAAGAPVIRVALVRDGPPPRYPSLADPLKMEILALTAGEFDVRFPPDLSVDGAWRLDAIAAAVDRVLADPRTDLAVTLGPISSHMAARGGDPPKPVIAAVVIDADLQGLPRDGESSGVRNLTYIDAFKSFARDVRTFRDLVPFTHLAVLVDRLILKTVPDLRRLARSAAHEYTMGVSIIPVGRRAGEALAELPPVTDAVMVTPLARLAPAEFQGLAEGLKERNLPSFSMMGRVEVADGIFAAAAPGTDRGRILRRIALNVQRILLGEAPGSIPVGFDREETLTINMATARAIGVYPGWRVLTEAVLLREEAVEVDRRLTLADAVAEALASNLSLSADAKRVAAGRQDVRRARAALLPDVDLSATGAVIDDDRAAASLGNQAERTVDVAVEATQLLYSEKALADHAVQAHLQNARVQAHEALRLDTFLDAAVAYLDVLRAETVEEIREENLMLTRANLKRARTRRTIGVAGPAEVYRWENEIANARKAVIAAGAGTRQAKISLNRLLHRPLEEPFEAAAVGMADPLLLVSDPRFFTYVDNPHRFRIFRDFLVADGVAHAPELKRLAASIAAQERALLSARRAFWSPTLALRTRLGRTLSETGAGSEGIEIPPEIPLSFPEADDTHWSVGISATLPLYDGGEKGADLRQARTELAALRIEAAAVAERIRERIRQALFETNKSYPAIRLSRDAARSAEKNLELVTDAYARGVVSVIDLLDAQNASLVADQVAANAVYDFLADMMAVHRAAGRFDLLLDPELREAWFQRLEAYFENEDRLESNF